MKVVSALVIAVASMGHGATIRVDPGGGGDFTEIQAAIDAARAGDTVLVVGGEYEITRPVTFGGKGIHLLGEAGPAGTTLRMAAAPLDPDRASVLIVEEEETQAAVLEGFTLTGGRGTARGGERQGGGVLIAANTSPCLVNCIIRGNTAHMGGGVFCEGAAPRMANCTVSGNAGGGIRCVSGSNLSVVNCVVWDNSGGAALVGLPEVSYSCIEGAWGILSQGEGNIVEDPQFCGWSRADVYVDGATAGPGDGSAEAPYPDLAAALLEDRYCLSLSSASPCVGSGEAGATRGAGLEVCDTPGSPAQRVHVAAGTYRTSDRMSFAHRIALEGAGQDGTTIEGTVTGLCTGAALSQLTVTGGTSGGVVVAVGEAPDIHHVTVTGNSGGGLVAGSASPRLTACTIAGNRTSGAGGGAVCGSSSRLEGCTIAGNRADEDGGGIWGSARVELIDCVITGNRAIRHGGGVCADSFASLKSCVVTGNMAEDGGGVYCSDDSFPSIANTARGNRCRMRASPEVECHRYYKNS